MRQNEQQNCGQILRLGEHTDEEIDEGEKRKTVTEQEARGTRVMSYWILVYGKIRTVQLLH